MGLSLPATVTLETKWFPPITVDLTGKEPPSISGQVAGVGLVLLVKALKPRATVKLNGTQIAKWQPAGDPDPNAWKTTKVVLLVALGLAAFRVVRLIL